MSGKLKMLGIAFKDVLDSAPWRKDVDLLEMPWQQEKLDSIRRRKSELGGANGRLVFGLMETDDLVVPESAIRRGLATVSQALKDRGYEVNSDQPAS